MDSEPRRINIEREQEWITIKEGITARAKQHTSEVLKESGADGDSELRRELEDLIARKLQYSFQLCVPNLQVNGYEYEDYLELTEPFNEPLDRALWSLSASKVEHATGTSSKRTTLPPSVLNNEIALEKARDEGEWHAPELGEREDLDGMVVDPPARHDDTVETFQTALSQLQHLAKTAPALVTRAERAKVVQEQVQALPV